MRDATNEQLARGSLAGLMYLIALRRDYGKELNADAHRLVDLVILSHLTRCATAGVKHQARAIIQGSTVRLEYKLKPIIRGQRSR